MREFARRHAVMCSVACEAARRKAAGDFSRMQAAMKAGKRAKRATITLEGFGRLSARELAIYERWRGNGRAGGYCAGRRKGWAEAIGEGDDMRRTA